MTKCVCAEKFVSHLSDLIHWDFTALIFISRKYIALYVTLRYMISEIAIVSLNTLTVSSWLVKLITFIMEIYVIIITVYATFRYNLRPHNITRVSVSVAEES